MRWVRSVVVMGLCALLCAGLAACSEENVEKTTAAPSGGDGGNETPAGGGGSDGGSGPGKGPFAEGGEQAESGTRIGAAGSACELPVSFETAKKWTAESVDGNHEQGGLRLACEVDAKPAGNIGYLRVWVGEKQEPGDALRRFVPEKKAEKVEYRSFTAGSKHASETVYERVTTIDGEELDRKPVQAFAIPGAKGEVAVVELGGMDAEEHEQIRPAYLLARATVKTR